jgi:DNA polymerase-1
MAPAVLPPPGDPSTLYVIDLSGYVFRAYHAIPPLSNSKGEPTHAVVGVTAMMTKLVTRRRPAFLAVAVDSRGPSFRKEIDPAYKATRRDRPADLELQAERVRQIAEAYGIPCLCAPGVEADDVIATVVRRAREAGLQVVIVSADKDLLQLVGEGVWMLDTMHDRVYGEDETFEKLGVRPAQVRDYLALTGDSADNVPGVPGVGPKTAMRLLAEFGTLDAIFEGLARVEKKSLREKLASHRDVALLSRRLVALRDDVSIEFDLEKLRYGGADVPRLRRIFTELELHRARAELERSLGRDAPREAVATGLVPPVPTGVPPRPKVAARVEARPAAPAPARRAYQHAVLGHLGELEDVLAAVRASGGLAMYTVIDGEDPLRDPIVGVAFAWDARAAYVPMAHAYPGQPAQLPWSDVVRLLRPLLEDPCLSRRGHDLKREALAWGRQGIKFCYGASDFDTMLASYLLDAERHAHSLEDVVRLDLGEDLPEWSALLPKVRGSRPRISGLEIERVGPAASARAAFVLELEALQRRRLEEAGLAALIRDVEMPLAKVLTDMERAGVRVDVERLRQLDAEAEEKLRTLERRCHELAGREFNVASPRALASVLFDELRLPVLKRTKTARSTDHEVLAELAVVHPLPEAILALRQLQKLRGTYLQALPARVDPADGRVHTRFHQAVAATGRLSSSDPNLQNIPIRAAEGRAIREAFIAAPGYLLLSADYSQIELRVLAHGSRDPELVDAFTTNADVHVRTAKALFGVDDAGVTRDMRARAKTVNFAVIYGQTEFALARNLKIDRHTARRYIDAFFARYAGVAAYLEALVQQARSTGEVRTLLGRRRRVPDIHSRDRRLRLAAERIAKNTPIQGSAADILKLAMIAVARRLEERKLASRMILTVHDELLLEVHEDEKDEVAALVRHEMENAFPLCVPLVVEIGIGPTWSAAH